MISVKILSSDENCETLMGHEKTKQKQNKQTIKQKTYKKKSNLSWNEHQPRV